MVDIPMKHKGPLGKNSLSSINNEKVRGSISFHTLTSLNQITDGSSNPRAAETSRATAPSFVPVSSPADTVRRLSVPALTNLVQKGQKISLPEINQTSRIKVCFGWNTGNAMCDADVSAFLLGSSAKVISDDWFVFYGQTQSPDKSIRFHMDDNLTDREYFTIDFSKLHGNVMKIVFVLTINEAIAHNLNFSMLSDAYIRIINMADNKEFVSFKIADYYSNITSMMFAELYLHNGNWKFSAVGNGVARDLAGLCEFYGVQTI